MTEDIISRLLANDPSLTTVGIHDIDLNQFCHFVQENSNIRILNLAFYSISMIAANDLSAALGRMPFLEAVTMTRCPWESVEVATALASSLAGRYTLQSLRLIDCNIDGGCVRAISTSFSEHQSLRQLYLQGNPIGNEGAISIGSLFAVNDSLKNVTVRESYICADGFKAIAEGVAPNRSLEKLFFIDNAVDFASFQSPFKRALYNGDSIEAVLTGSNHTMNDMRPIGDVGLCLLMAMNSDGPDAARRRKLILFLYENPGSVVVHDHLLPSAIEMIGRVGGLDAMYLLVRDIPDMFKKAGIS